MRISVIDTQEKILTKVLMLKGEKGDKGDPGELTNLDTELSTTSTNAVQNKVITNALNTLTENSATNSFTDGIDSLFKDVKANIQAVQAGSGTPSPTNVRTISGFTECTVTDTNGTDTNTATISFGSAGTVYGGEVDLTTGLLTVTHGSVDLGSLNWVYQSDTSRFYVASPSDLKRPSANSVSINGICEVYNVRPYEVYGNYDLAVTTTGSMFVKNSDYTDATAFKTAMSGKKLVYELATPVEYQLTPAQLRSLVGTNNLTSNTGDTVEVEYITNETIAWLLDLINA